MLIFCPREKYRELQQRRERTGGVPHEISDALHSARAVIEESEPKLERLTELLSQTLNTAASEKLETESEATRRRLAAAKTVESNALAKQTDYTAALKRWDRGTDAIERRLAGLSIRYDDADAMGAPCAREGEHAELDRMYRGLSECEYKLSHNPGPTRAYYERRAAEWRTKISELEHALNESVAEGV